MAPVNVVLSQSKYLYYNLHFIPDVFLFTLMQHVIHKIPIGGTDGLIVLYDQSCVAKMKVRSILALALILEE